MPRSFLFLTLAAAFVSSSPARAEENAQKETAQTAATTARDQPANTVAIQSPATDTGFVIDSDCDLALAPADFDLPGQVKSFADLYKLSADGKTTKIMTWGNEAKPFNNFQYNALPVGFSASYGNYRIPGTEGPNTMDNTISRGVDFKIFYKDLKKSTVGLHILVNDNRTSEKAADNLYNFDTTVPREGFEIIKLGPPLDGKQAWVALQTNKIVENSPPENVTPVKLLPGNKIEFHFTAADGSQVDTTKMLGKVILIDYWATWCGPCIEALPQLEKLYEKYHERGFEIIGINLNDNRAIMDRFLATHKHPWPQSIAAAAGNNPLADPLGFTTIPTFLLIDKTGAYTTIDARNPDTAEKIEALLAK